MESLRFLGLGFSRFGLELQPDLIIVAFAVACELYSVELNFSHDHRVRFLILVAAKRQFLK